MTWLPPYWMFSEKVIKHLFVFLFLELVFPISIYRKTYIRNSKCWLNNRYGARSVRYNWRGIEPLKITNDILRKVNPWKVSVLFSDSFYVLCFPLFFLFLYKYRVVIFSDLFG
jgi:hypothetical protein